jgi:hypothetical protein
MSLAYRNATASQLDSPSIGNVSKVLHHLGTAGRLEVRIGYFGSCLISPGESWFCGSEEAMLKKLEQVWKGDDPLGLIEIAKQIQHGVLFTGFL